VVRVEVVHRRCAGTDISKKDAKVCVRIHGSGRRATTAIVTTWGAMSNEILALREHLVAEKVTCVVMESTGDYWKRFYYLLEDAVNLMLVNPRDARNRPGAGGTSANSPRSGSEWSTTDRIGDVTGVRTVISPDAGPRPPSRRAQRAPAAGQPHVGGSRADQVK
jgi:hypothetical protein